MKPHQPSLPRKAKRTQEEALSAKLGRQSAEEQRAAAVLLATLEEKEAMRPPPSPSLLLPLPVSLLYTHSLAPYCCPYPCPYCTLTPSFPSRRCAARVWSARRSTVRHARRSWWRRARATRRPPRCSARSILRASRRVASRAHPPHSLHLPGRLRAHTHAQSSSFVHLLDLWAGGPGGV